MDWTYHFEAPKFDKDGKEVVYGLRVEEVPGYVPEVSGDHVKGYTITLTNPKAERLDIPVDVVWKNDEGHEEDRPAQVDVKLKAVDGHYIHAAAIAEDMGWSFNFNAPKFDKRGEEVSYGLRVEKVDGYIPELSGDFKHGFTITLTKAKEETLTVPVSVVWKNDKGHEEDRPAQVDVKLKATEGGFVHGVALTEDMDWAYNFEAPKGARYGLKVEEVPGYVPEVSGDDVKGYTITLTKAKEETLTVPVSVVWKNDEGHEEDRPAQVDVKLKATEGGFVHGVALTEDMDWAYNFEAPKGVRYGLKVEEVSGYVPEVSGDDVKGYTITLTLKEEPVEPTVPEPTDPEPTDPEATDPEPTDPEPTDPEPTDPEPTDSKPTEPEETDPEETEAEETEAVDETTEASKSDEEAKKDADDTVTKTGEGIVYTVIGVALLALGIVLAIIRKKFRKNPNQD